MWPSSVVRGYIEILTLVHLEVERPGYRVTIGTGNPRAVRDEIWGGWILDLVAGSDHRLIGLFTSPRADLNCEYICLFI
jgi:hypothetical protein